MKKIIAIILASLIVFFGVVLFLTIKFQKNNEVSDEILTINEAYFYNENKQLNIKFYAKKEDSVLNYLKDGESYLYDNNDKIIKIEAVDYEAKDLIMYKNTNYYVYNYTFNLNANNINFDECYYKSIINDKTMNIKLGSLHYYEKAKYNSFTKMEKLYGLSFDNPYLSTGAIFIRINNKEADLTIDNVTIPDLKVNKRIVTEELEEETSINAYFSYQYNVSIIDDTVKINHNEKKDILLVVQYNQDILYSRFPIVISIQDNDYLIDSFEYININNLDNVSKILNTGSYDV